jgi:hypothetical protein
MSENKRSDNDFHFGHGERSQPTTAPTVDSHAATTPAIEESQPRQTLEVPRANAVWQFHREQSTDPYNSVGAHAISPRSYRTRAA